MKNILVTGGTGYIGSHTVVELLEIGYQVVILDNLSNSSKLVLKKITEITGEAAVFVEGDIRQRDLLDDLFELYDFAAVIHFAGLKAVGESVEQPLSYYQNNVAGSVVLFEVMQKYNCRNLVFSSSATVYGDPQSVPIDEKAPLSATNPYGRSKLMVEEILRDLAVSQEGWQIALLRYFNPVAAHPSGLIGENPKGIPNNLMPYIAQVGVGKLEQLSIFGDDYDTPDGTGVRDYIHVVDLAQAHLRALQTLDQVDGCEAFNIGTGTGYSVMEMVKAFEKASGKTVPFVIKARRTGDIATCFADVSLSKEKLLWQAEHGLDQMMEDQWRWQNENPDGYEEYVINVV